MTPRAAQRLLVLGWDAADWQVMDPLLARGRMPNLARLVAAGTRADLRTLEPKLSPLLWSTIATGKTADRHGILNFVEPSPSGDGVRVSASTSRRTRALWNILTLRGLRVHAVGWYASHPAEPIRGACISNLLMEGAPASADAPWPMLDGTVHGPEGLAARVAAARVRPSSIDRAALRAFLPTVAQASRGDDRPATLAKELARMRSLHQAALEAVRSSAWDCAMVFHDTIDTIGHHFMGCRPPRMPNATAADLRVWGEVMDRTYCEHDRLLGELLEATGPGTSVMLLSDHGFHSGAARPVIADVTKEERAALESRWHRELGVLVLSGPGFKARAQVPAPTLLDIAPTALAALGLPVGRDMGGRVIAEAFEPAVAISAVESWDLEPGDAGEHPPEMRQDPFEAADALRQLVDLGYMADLGDDQKRLVELTRRESRFNEAAVLMTTGRPAQAVPILSSLVGECPAEVRYRSSLAHASFSACDHAGCLDAVKAWEELAPGSADAAVLRVAALAGLGRIDDAGRALAEFESSHGSRPEHARTSAELCARLGRWQESLAHAKRAIAREPGLPEGHLAAARAALELGDFESAAEHALDAAERSMVIPEVHFVLGAALAWGGELEHAARSLDVALTLSPGYREAAEFAASVSEVRGDASAAMAASGRAASSAPMHGGRPTVRDAAAWRASRRG
jgi:tetratricopeptide (TPR) repeat protein